MRLVRRSLAVLASAVLATAIAQWFDDDPPRDPPLAQAAIEPAR
jgi:hypothetical protein